MNNYYNPGYMNYYQPQQQARPNIGFSSVNGIDDAKAFIVGPNQTYWLKDNLSNVIFEKKADAQGRYSLEIYELVKQNQEQDYVRRSELNALQEQIKELANSIKGSGSE